jgi:hypothetical protein
MRKLLKVAGAALLLMLAVLSVILWFKGAILRVPDLSSEFHAVLDSPQRPIDLGRISGVEWDELVFWSPYSDICDYGITSFEKGGLRCRSSVDDSESYLLFLRKNELAGIVPLERKRFDLGEAHLQGRIPRARARFELKMKDNRFEARVVE